MKTKKITLSIISAMFLASCGAQTSGGNRQSEGTYRQNSGTVPYKNQPSPVGNIPKADTTKPIAVPLNLPQVPREFRAAWIASVANINWPKPGNFSTEKQKADAIEILDNLKKLNFNAVILQVRPSADALYKSDLEPWSYYLTGEIGKAPSPYYDPLEFWITETHKRGMELHAWLNPYRAHHTAGGEVTDKSIVRKMPDQVLRLKNGMYWMDPSDQKVQDHSAAVVHDLVKRYDLDAIHVDDYFYPYAEYNKGADFPDSKTWDTYLKSGGTLSKADWRRGNINRFIKRLHDEIHAEKPFVKFGISPFGIWKAGYPADIKGSSQYDDLFADAKLWLNQGWCDYFTPQLYWKEGGPQSFSSLLKWWNDENTSKIHLWPGLNTVEVRTPIDRVQEISAQIQTTRRLLGENAGEVHWNVEGVTKNYKMETAVQSLYKDDALIPASPWMQKGRTEVPVMKTTALDGKFRIDWSVTNKFGVSHYILYKKYGSKWQFELLESGKTSADINSFYNGEKLTAIALKAVSRAGIESDPAVYTVK